jgi:hypothetical protein
MIARQALAMAQVVARPAAELAPVIIPGEEERVGHLAAEPPGDVHEADEPDHRGTGDTHRRAAHHATGVGLDDLGLPVDHEHSARRTGTIVGGS